VTNTTPTTFQGTIYGHELWCERPLGWLDHEPGSDKPIVVTIADTSEFSSLDQRNDAHEAAAETRVELTTLGDGRMVAELDVLGAFVLDPVRLQILAPVPPPTRYALWEHTLYSWSIPLLLSASGRLVLHAAAVDTEAGAVLVVGPTTRGKTSFASEAVKRGYRLLGEDGIAIRVDSGTGRATAYPGCSGVRLRHDDEGHPVAKVTQAVPHGMRCSEPRPVAAIIALAPRTADGTTVERLSAAKAISALRINSLAFPEALPRLYSTLVAVVSGTPVATASLREGLIHLPSEIERLIAWASHVQAVAA
jgi:hypothetical protein